MRADRIWPDVYLGRPGALVTMPWPRGGVEPGYERQTADFVTGSGRHRVSKMQGGSRLYGLNWNALGLDTFSRVEQFQTGAMGIGPWAFIDPSRGNFLSANQSSATSALGTVEGLFTFQVSEGTPKVNTSAAYIRRTGAPSSIRWHFTVAVASFPVMTFPSVYSAWPGIPVTTASPYTFSVYVCADGVVDSAMTVAAKVQWFNAAGSPVGDSTSGDTAITTSWTQLVASATPPVGAAFGMPFLVAIGSTLTTNSSMYVDQPQFEMGSTPNIWVPGTGLYPVEIMDLTESIPFAASFRESPSLVLREVVG